MIAQASYGDDTAVLFAELHHRFFNSFQVISGLAARCGRVKSTSELQPILDDLDTRISAFAAVHRLLACPTAQDTVESSCRALCVNLLRAFGRTDDVVFAFADVPLSKIQAERIPIIVVEMVTNVLKHGSRVHEGGRIVIVVVAGPSSIEVSVSDDGATACPALKPLPSRTVEALAISLGGRAFVEDRGGYVSCVEVPLERTVGPRLRLTVAARRGFDDVAA